jgi:imidazolonepropionase-like amidohydrolase
LINAHVHLAFDVSCDPVPALERGDAATLRATIARQALELLDEGVTTARDLGDRDGLVAEFRDGVAAGTQIGPRMLTAGAPLTSPRGHCWFLGGEVAGEAEIRAAVEQRAARGADWIKVMAGGGRLTPLAAPVWESQFSERELEVVVAAAREVGLPVSAHAHGTDTMRLCARAGVTTIEHGGWLTGPTAEPRCYDPRDDIAALIATAGVAVVPTRARNWRNWPPEAGLHGLLERLAWMDRHGIQLVAGTDAGVGRGFFDDFVETLTLYRAAGWSTPRVLAMATTLAASALGLGERTGQLKPGFDADLLVVTGDPLTDLESLRNVQCVLAAGRTHHPPARTP